jgi:predicted RNA-binding Zn-ribbon protein involved in translation (DUF1610 family)
MESSKCPKCGDDPHFIAHVDKWYCFGCNSYIDDVEEEPQAEERAGDEVVLDLVEKAVSVTPEPAGAEHLECKSCGAELQDLKDGRFYCFMCESYQDEIKEQPDHGENEAQVLVDQASIAVPSISPAATQVPVTTPSVPTPDTKPAEVSTSPSPPLAQANATPISPEPSALVEPRAPSAEKPTFVRMCTSCGQPLKYIDKYQRYYCYGCKKYASKDEKLKGTSEGKKCPECGGELRFIEKYNEHYCNACKKYPLRAGSAVAAVKTEVLLCPKCSAPLKWIEKYSRHYCYTCKEYAPKGYSGTLAPSTSSEKKTCPSCNESMKYIAEYDEWYCYKCRKYSLRPNKPAMFL